VVGAPTLLLVLEQALNGLQYGVMLFLMAAGLTLVFGIMNLVNLAHGSLYLLGAYVGYVVGDKTGSWLVAVAAGFASAALFGLVLQVAVFRFMHGEDLRQTLVTIGLSIMMADVLLWIFGGEIYQFDPPRVIFGRTPLPIVEVYPTYRLVLLLMSVAIGVLLWWFLNRTRVGMMIRAGVDDYGLIPGAMGQASFVIRGLGNPDAYESCAHGAGRLMSRRRARSTLSVEDFDPVMGDTSWQREFAEQLLDEHPSAYKPIDVVMRDQADLVEVEHELHAIANYKGTS